MKYDTLIIGAGLSGLAAGVRLAYYEKRVCVLERHTTIGGLNSFYRLRGKNHDVGLHAVTNWRPPGSKTGPLAKLLRQLRLSWDDFGLAPQFGSAVAFPGVRLRFTNDFAVLEQEVAEKFPSQIDGFRRFVAHLDGVDLFDDSPREVSARGVAAEFLSDPLLVEMLFCPVLFYGSPTPNDCDLRQFAILFNALYKEGFGRPRNGVRPILKALTRQYKALGGELRLRAGVRRLLHDGRRVTGVELDSGETLEAGNVLSSAGSAETAGMLNGSGVEWPGGPPEPGALSFVESISVLDREPAELDLNDTILFFNDSPTFRYEPPAEPVDVRSGIVCVPNNYRYDAPLDDGRVRMTAIANPGYWFSLPEDEYAREKAAWFERMADAACRFLPADFRPHATDLDVFTPRTITRFTGHANGCVYGAPRKWRDGRTPLENLYLCGTDQGYLGIVGAMLSGVSMANAHLLR
ncbi:MAG TPA: NAD(P)/FAD-dependent oxidoreductase [Planctomycetaceae bacterium]